MRGWTIRLAAPAITIALAAGCGSGSGAAAPGFGAAAAAVPAHSLVFVDVDLDRGSSGWRNLERLGPRIPGWAALGAQLRAQMAHSSGQGSFDSEIRPWLGDEAGVAVTSVDVSGPNPKPVVEAYVAVTDESALKRTLTGPGHFTPTGSSGGYALYRNQRRSAYAAVSSSALLLATTGAALHQQIDLRGGHGASLAANSAYRHTIAALPGSRLITGYVDGARLGQLIDLAMLSGPQLPGASPAGMAQIQKALTQLAGIGFSLSADPGGVRLAFDASRAPGGGSEQVQQFSPTLIHDVPAGALAYVGLHGSPRLAGGAALSGAMGEAAIPAQVRPLLTLVREAAPLLTGEIGFDVVPGAPVGANLLLAPADPAAAGTALTHILTGLRRMVPHPVIAGSATGGALRFPGSPVIRWQHRGGLIEIGTSPGPAGASLATAPAFTSLLAQAGVPTRVTALAYLNVPALAGLAPGAPPALHALGGLVGWTQMANGTALGELYLAIPAR